MEEFITIGHGPRCASQDIIVPSYMRPKLYLLENVPIIISAQDSDLIGVGTPQTQDA